MRYRVADMITGYGVAESVRHFYGLYGGEVRGKRVLVQGWGNVGAAAALYLAKQGALITGIIDRAGGFLRPEGMGLDEIRSLFLAKEGNALSAPGLQSFEDVNAAIWDVGLKCSCHARRRASSPRTSWTALAGGLGSSPAGPMCRLQARNFLRSHFREADGACAVIPDIANCGMARVFGYLMGDGDVHLEDNAIFGHGCIRAAMERCHARSPERTGLSSTGLSIALEQLL